MDKYDTFYLGNLKKLHCFIKDTKPKLIVGLGDNNIINNLRIETIYTNRFGDKEIVKGGSIQYKIETSRLDHKYIGDKKFGGFCNRAGYSVSSFIDRLGIDAKSIFIHLPKKSDVIDIYGKLLNILNMF